MRRLHPSIPLFLFLAILSLGLAAAGQFALVAAGQLAQFDLAVEQRQSRCRRLAAALAGAATTMPAVVRPTTKAVEARPPTVFLSITFSHSYRRRGDGL
mgnify:CR=1 FL=1